MKAFVLERLDAPTTVRDDLPEPTPGEQALLVRVSASSVNPVDAAIAAGMLGTLADYEFPVVLGRDFAGTVEQTGAGVTRYAPGTRCMASCRTSTPPCMMAAGRS